MARRGPGTLEACGRLQDPAHHALMAQRRRRGHQQHPVEELVAAPVVGEGREIAEGVTRNDHGQGRNSLSYFRWYSATDWIFWPAALVPSVITVRVARVFDTIMLPVCTTAPARLRVNVILYAETRVRLTMS